MWHLRASTLAPAVLFLALTGADASEPDPELTACCLSGERYIVHFSPATHAPLFGADTIMDNAVATFRRQKQVRLGLYGTTSSDEFNIQLALRRVEAVRKALMARGVSLDMIDVEALGEDPSLGARQPRQGRFEITYGIGAGT
ncbi:MAG TPA: OmpA family protein [Allosphingosinicella sp.]|uniref:OmpA family protein n=1 Tax=Allosphingosinicella sp. TaxID=2823234 RepID=UPI002EDAF3A7